MKKHKHNSSPYGEGRTHIIVNIALVVIMIFASVGAVLAVVHAKSAGLAAFELITFSVCVAALLLAVIGSANGAYQMRITRHIAHEVRQAINELRDIDKANEIIKKRLDEDYELARDIADALRDAGVIDDDARRREVARSIERKVRSRR